MDDRSCGIVFGEGWSRIIALIMSQPSIEYLGVYTVPCNQVVWHEDIDGYYRSLKSSA